MTHKFDSGIHDLSVCILLTHMGSTLAEAWVKKDEHFINQKCYMDPTKNFDFLNVRPFSPRGFFTFLVIVALGASGQIQESLELQQCVDKICTGFTWLHSR